MTMPRRDFMGIQLSDPTVDGLIAALTSERAPRLVGYLNAHTTNLALRQRSALLPLLRRFELVYPDGMAVVRAARRRGFGVRERVSAADFFLRFCWAAATRGRTLALVGGTPQVAAGCAEALVAEIPSLKIVHASHGYLAPGSEARRQVIQSLRALRPDITLVGMGSPQQEAFAVELSEAAQLPCIWCVGALFEYHAPGVRAHAPLWMRQAGLEWAFRLAQEPRRLASRYLLGNLEFLLRTYR